MLEQDQLSPSLSRQAYEQLRDRIITLRCAPGELLDEGELKESLGFGRTPIREALQRLACEGLVVIRPRRGTYVANLSVTDLNQIFELRLELEGYASALAAERASESDMLAMERALAPLAQASDLNGGLMCIDVDRAFHRALAHAAHNKFLENELARMYNLNLRLWYFALDRLGAIRETVEQHRALINGIRCRDSHLAEAAMRKHVRDFQARVKGVL